MDWAAVRRHKRKASARKMRGERASASRKAMIERLGGPVGVDEIRDAPREVRMCRDTFYQHQFTVEVFMLRGREWRVIAWDETAAMLTPHLANRKNIPPRAEMVPLTPGARKWIFALWEIFPCS